MDQAYQSRIQAVREKVRQAHQAALENIYRRVDAIEPAGVKGCMEWPGCRGFRAQVWIGGKGYMVARLVLERQLGRKIRPGYYACHHCDHRWCVNPEHLYEGTKKDDARDRETRNLEYTETRRKRIRSPEHSERMRKMRQAQTERQREEAAWRGRWVADQLAKAGSARL
jgi:hypothetical protein